MPLPIITALVLATQAAAAPPSAPAEAQAAGERLARAGLFASLFPLLAASNVQEVLDAHPELSPGKRQAVRAAADAKLSEVKVAMVHAEGHALAERLTTAELATAAAFFEGPAGAAYKGSLPQIVVALKASGAVDDVKGQIEARVCRDTQVCPKPRR